MTYTQRRMLRRRMIRRAALTIHIKSAAASIRGFVPELIAGIAFLVLFFVIAILGALVL